MEKKLIVYYTYTGHTKYIVDKIKKTINCDVLEIKPEKPYSDDYDLVVSEQQNNESTKETPKLVDLGVNLKEYDEIILGSPVWWYTIVPPIRTFLKENDLADKKIIPFATNAGWIGRTFKEIKDLCPNSIIENEMNIVFGEDYTSNDLVTNEKDIDEWIKKL